MKSQETEWDVYESRLRLWRVLSNSIYQIWQGFALELRTTPCDGAEWRWWQAYEAEKENVRSDRSAGYDAWLAEYVRKHEVTAATARGELYFHSLYLEHWRKSNPPVGICRNVLKWEKQYFQLLHCQGEWVGYRAACCGENTRPVAVPIGCNHRLCPLCNWHRSQNAQRRVKQLFDRLSHPQFITLTVPNTRRVTKRTFEHFRKRIRQFFAQHKEMFGGGVYSLETTFNRVEKTWHVHGHALVDASYSLPANDQRVEFAGRNLPAFTYIKMALEFDWSRLWCKSLPKRPRKNARREVMDGERWEFERWVRASWANSLKERRGRDVVPIEGLSESEMRARTEWNKANRRVMSIRPVDDREKAVKEVLKYITKCSEFVDLPDAIVEFHEATRGARLIQTFGSWYGIDFAADFDTKHLDDWGHMPQCACGVNEWQRMGIFQRRDVRMETDGRWFLQSHYDHNARGTLARPRIRVLSTSELRTGDRP
jgi:hypothetical protein